MIEDARSAKDFALGGLGLQDVIVELDLERI